MIDAGHELEALKNKLVMQGMSEQRAIIICNMASNDIQEAVIDIMTESLKDAVSSSRDNLSHKARSHKFVQEVMAIRDGNLFKITTASGKTDFSEPPFPMLPKLLTNAKVSKDGSRYKKIPMRKDLNDKKSSKTIENALMNINKHRQQLKAEKDHRKDGGTLQDPVEHIGSIKASSSAEEHSRFVAKANATEFRTASDKQDPNSTWVRSAIKADMTEELSRINDSMQDEIDQAIVNIISKYKGSY